MGFLGVAAFAGVAGAATISDSASAPASAAIAQPDASNGATSNGYNYTDQSFGGSAGTGQTFVPASSFSLTSFTMKGNGDAGGGVTSHLWSVDIFSAAGNYYTAPLAILDHETADPSTITGNSDYITFTLATPVPLTAGTVYGFNVTSGGGYFGFTQSTTDVYAPGFDSNVIYSGPTLANFTGGDKTFFVNAVAPEPASLGTLAIGALVALRRRRVRR